MIELILIFRMYFFFVYIKRAIIWLCQRGKTHEIYNLVDEAESTQESITKIIANIFGVEYDFCGTVMSRLAAVCILPSINENTIPLIL